MSALLGAPKSDAPDTKKRRGRAFLLPCRFTKIFGRTMLKTFLFTLARELLLKIVREALGRIGKMGWHLNEHVVSKCDVCAKS
jgi:hypothetical protein